MQNANHPRPISPTGFLNGVAGVAGMAATASLLNACAVPGTPAGAPAGQSGAAPFDVYTLTPAFFAEMGMAAATDLYNEQLAEAAADHRIVMEETPDGWETKAMAMIREQNIRWSASGYSQFDEQWRHIKQGLAQPIDDLLQSSQVPWAQDHQNSFIYPNIYETTRFEGKTYFIPMKLNIFMAGYRQDYLEAARL